LASNEFKLRVSIIFDFATSEPCASGALPRMKIGLSMIFRVYQAIFKGGTIHNFVMLNALAHTTAAHGAIPPCHGLAARRILDAEAVNGTI